jgi:CBS domain-containing protein
MRIAFLRCELRSNLENDAAIGGYDMNAFTETTNRTALLAKTAEDTMTANPLSLREHATVDEAIAFLSLRRFGGAPVIDDAGKPVGFVGKTDLLHAVHSSNGSANGSAIGVGRDGAELLGATPAGKRAALCTCPVTVGEIMTPALVVVPRNASMTHVIKKMIARRVHRVFVIDATGALIGVISGLDALRALCE